MNKNDFKKNTVQEGEPLEKDVAQALHKASELEEARLLKEYNDRLDEMEARGIDVPDELVERLECILGIRLKRKSKSRRFLLKTAAILLLFFTVATAALVIDRENVTAFRRIIIGVFSSKTEVSEDFHSQEVPLPDYFPVLPDGFQLEGSYGNDNAVVFHYENGDKQFLKITIYSAGYFISLDNEDFEKYEDVEINESFGKKLVKNGTTALVIFYGQDCIAIESNLPESEICDFAGGIKPFLEGGKN